MHNILTCTTLTLHFLKDDITEFSTLGIMHLENNAARIENTTK